MTGIGWTKTARRITDMAAAPLDYRKNWQHSSNPNASRKDAADACLQRAQTRFTAFSLAYLLLYFVGGPASWLDSMSAYGVRLPDRDESSDDATADAVKRRLLLEFVWVSCRIWDSLSFCGR